MSPDGGADGGPDDRALLRRHVDGDPDAFGELVRRHRERLWAVAVRTLRDPDEAADALQDALVSAFRRAESYRGDAAVTTWLHRIVVNACLDRARRRAVRRVEPLPETDDRTHATAADLATRSVEDATEDVERRDAVLMALQQLAPEQRAALVLVDMEGYSVDEAATVLDCAPGTVKSRCSRGRTRLLPLLADWAPRRPVDPPDKSAAVTEPLPAGVRPTPAARSRPTDDRPTRTGGDPDVGS
jgi:RNA polymerase sigma factor (sigma-70 family)